MVLSCLSLFLLNQKLKEQPLFGDCFAQTSISACGVTRRTDVAASVPRGGFSQTQCAHTSHLSMALGTLSSDKNSPATTRHPQRGGNVHHMSERENGSNFNPKSQFSGMHPAQSTVSLSCESLLPFLCSFTGMSFQLHPSVRKPQSPCLRHHGQGSQRDFLHTAARWSSLIPLS